MLLDHAPDESYKRVKVGKRPYWYREIENGKATTLEFAANMLPVAAGELHMDTPTIMHLRDIYVGERLRKHGLGDYLLDRSMEIAKLRGVELVHAEVIYDDHCINVQAGWDSVDWYRRRGFVIEPCEDKRTLAKMHLTLQH